MASKSNKPWMTWNLQELKNAVVARDITPVVAETLVHVWRVAKQAGRLPVIDCDRVSDSKGLTAREIAYAYRTALAQLGHVGQSGRQIAGWAGYGVAEYERLKVDNAINQRVREYVAELASGAGWTVEDLRAIALSKLASVAMAEVGDFFDYGAERAPIVAPENGGAKGQGMTSGDCLLVNSSSDGAMHTSAGGGLAGDMVSACKCSDTNGEPCGAGCTCSAGNGSRCAQARRRESDSERVDLDLGSSNCFSQLVSGGWGQDCSSKKNPGGPTSTAAQNFQPSINLSPTESAMLTELTNELTVQPNDIEQIAIERPGIDNQSFVLSDGTKVRMRQLNELPAHLGGAVKSLRYKSVGMAETADGKKIPIIVPEMELYDSIRAAELLLKYNGDIGTNKKDADLAGAIDIAEFMNAARARANNAKKGKRKDDDVIDAQFESGSDSRGAEDRQGERQEEVDGQEDC